MKGEEDEGIEEKNRSGSRSTTMEVGCDELVRSLSLSVSVVDGKD